MDAPVADPVASSLADALITASNAPVILLNGRATVVAVSKTFCTTFNLHAEQVHGTAIYAIGAEWDCPPLHALLDATFGGLVNPEGYEFDLASPCGPRRLELKAQMLDYDDASNVRVLLAVSDVTDFRASARLNQDLVQENSFLLQQVQHRVPNSLQMLASLITQNARAFQKGDDSPERARARAAAVAAVHDQLVEPPVSRVELRPYLAQLCESLGTAMLEERRRIALSVEIDETTVAASASVMLGLIVTELVINALKHAFPQNLGGAIRVRYAAAYGGWQLSVTDDGVGVDARGNAVRPGLGTAIVAALAKQLGGHFDIADAAPGLRCAVACNLRSSREVRLLTH